MNLMFLILVLIGVIALAFWSLGDREDRERSNRRRALREAREEAVRKRQARASRGVR